MRLTDPALPWLVGAGTAVVFVALVLGLPRVKPRGGQMAIRAGAAILTNAGVVLLSFLILNNSYVFYSSWSDLFGQTEPATVTQRGGSISTIEKVGPQSSLPQTLGTKRDYLLPQPHRRLQTYHVRDAASHATMGVMVELPARYNPASSRRYPVIIGLHGFPGGPKSFTHINFLRTANALSREHRLAQSLIVIPQIDSPARLDTECVNGPTGTPQTDTWLSKELPHWVVQHLHAETSRNDWATLGYSYGGWCAAELAIRHPSTFAAAVVFEGYFEPDFGRHYDPLTTPALRAGYDLIKITQRKPPPVGIWLFASKQDHLAYPTTRRFIRVARTPMALHAVIVPTGGHRNNIFEPYTPGAFEWLAHNLSGFRG